MAERSQYDRPLAYGDNGEPDLWDSDTIEGRARIHKRQAQAEDARHAAGKRDITIAEGLWWTDRKSGERKWSGGTQILDMIDKSIRTALAGEKDARRKGLEGITEAVAVAFKAERAKMREQQESDFRELSLEIREEIAVLKRQRADLAEQVEELRALKQPRLVRGGAA